MGQSGALAKNLLGMEPSGQGAQDQENVLEGATWALQGSRLILQVGLLLPGPGVNSLLPASQLVT